DCCTAAFRSYFATGFRVAVGTAVASLPPRRMRLSRTGLLSQGERDRHSGYWVPMQLRSVGSVLQCHAVPALSPEHASQLPLPSTGRRPSTVSAADFIRLCSRLHRYNAAVRLLIRVHAHRSAVAFMGRSGVLAGHG